MLALRGTSPQTPEIPSNSPHRDHLCQILEELRPALRAEPLHQCPRFADQQALHLLVLQDDVGHIWRSEGFQLTIAPRHSVEPGHHHEVEDVQIGMHALKVEHQRACDHVDLVCKVQLDLGPLTSSGAPEECPRLNLQPVSENNTETVPSRFHASSELAEEIGHSNVCRQGVRIQAEPWTHTRYVLDLDRTGQEGVATEEMCQGVLRHLPRDSLELVGVGLHAMPQLLGDL